MGEADPGRDDADATSAYEIAGGDELGRLADSGFIGEQRAGAAGEEGRAGVLKGFKLHGAPQG
jgi:hypothetical protein